jgi:molecular chaperone DnaK
MGGIATKLIEKNTTIPASKSQVFSTAADNQTQVEIHIVQGERAQAVDNKSLGRFVLDGIPPAPRGIPQIEVSFDIDANGILKVSAKDKATNKEQSIRIESSSGLSKEEIEKMTKDAEAHATEDEAKKKLIEHKNTAEQTIYASEKLLNENKDKISEDDQKSLSEKVANLRSKVSTDNASDIDSATVELSKVMNEISTKMYQSAQQAEAPQGDTTEAKEAEEVKKEEGEEQK